MSIIRIYDPKRTIGDKHVESKIEFEDGSECIINRISSKQLVAMVKNRNCFISKIVSESGCLVVSSIAETNNDIRWTVVGIDSNSISDLIDRLKEHGFNVRTVGTYNSETDLLLSNKQEQALQTAYENGYYEIPRKTNIENLSKLVESSRSAFDVTLRTAEMKVILNHLINNLDFRKK